MIPQEYKEVPPFLAFVAGTALVAAGIILREFWYELFYLGGVVLGFIIISIAIGYLFLGTLVILADRFLFPNN